MISIVYKPNILINLTGNTIDYSISNSAITSDIFISSGMSFNLYEFDNLSINRIDIIDNIINYTIGINKYQLNILIVDSGQTYNSINKVGMYCIKILYENETLDYLLLDVYYNNLPYKPIIIETIHTPSIIKITTPFIPQEPIILGPPIIVYKHVMLNITGNTIDYFFDSPVYIESGFTLNLHDFDNEIINRVDIINNIINYTVNINKYQLDILIVDTGQTHIDIIQSGLYCIKVSFSGETLNYLMMNIIYSIETYIPPIVELPLIPSISDNSIDITGVNKKNPIIYYNPQPISGGTWIGSGTTIPYNVFLDLYHNDINGWTLNSLQTLFISGITDCFDGVLSLSAMTFILYENGSNISLSGILKSGIYNIYISVTDSAGNNTMNWISNIIVDDEPPVIVYRPYVIMNITGNTNMYSGASSGFTDNINITSGFTFNLNEFDRNIITRLDIIENIVSYAYDIVDIDLTKYKIEVLMASKHNNNGPIVYTEATLPGEYCVKFLLIDSNKNNTVQYFMMNVIYDVTVYSDGYWQDNKVWVDFVLWKDHPKNSIL